MMLALLTGAAVAQPFSAGLIGGASLTQDFQNLIIERPPSASEIAYSTPKRWMAGATAEVHLPFHLSVEADAIYHELEFTQATVEPNGKLNSVSPAPVVTWEFPVLLKYRFSLPVLKPFVDAGPVFRSIGNLNGARPGHDGVTASLGVEARLWKLRVAPQFRYLRWTRDSDELPGLPTTFFGVPATVRDQVEFLTALTF